MRNELYLAADCPASWRSEVKLTVKGELSIVADALFTVGGRYNIIEIDHTQKMAVNREKITKYKRLCELGVFKKQPQFTWLTTTEYRRKELTLLCEGLTARIYTVSDFK